MTWFLSTAPLQTSAAVPEETTAASLINDDKQEKAQQEELINAGGLKLSLYAVSKHREVTRNAMLLYSVLCEVEDQMYMIYTQEI